MSVDGVNALVNMVNALAVAYAAAQLRKLRTEVKEETDRLIEKERGELH